MHLWQTRRISKLWFSRAITSISLLYFHTPQNHQIYSLTKLTSKEIYSILIESGDSKPSSLLLYYKNVFQNSNLDWKTMSVLPHLATKDPRLRVFQ